MLDAVAHPASSILERATGRAVATTERAPRPPACVDLQAERAVLAAVLLDGQAEGRYGVWPRVSAILTSEDFHHPQHAVMWEAFGRVIARGGDLDVITGVAELRRMERLNTVGGAQAVGEITDEIPTLAHCESHARIVAELAARRRLGTLLANAARTLAAGGGAAAEVQAKVLAEIMAVRIPCATVAPTLGDDVMGWADEIDRRLAGTEAPLLSTGLADLDLAMGGGIGPGMVLLAARPRVGKTALALQVALRVAQDTGPVYVLSLEMSRRQLLRAAAACEGRVHLSHIQNPRTLASGEDAAMYAAVNRVGGLPLYVVDAETRGCPATVPALAAALAALPRRPTLVIVDHIGKLLPVGKHRERKDMMREIGDALHRLGLALGIPILTLVHIGRGMAKGDVYRLPRLEDVVESSTLEADADAVVILHREDLYPTKKYGRDDGPEPGLTHVLVSKVRWSEPGRVGRLRFRGEHQRFSSTLGHDGPGEAGARDTNDPFAGEGLPVDDVPAFPGETRPLALAPADDGTVGAPW